MPLAFTEQGIAMLSGVLNSDRAIQVNIQIMRTFTKLRHMIAISEDLKRELKDLRDQTDQRFQIVFEALECFGRGKPDGIFRKVQDDPR